MRPWERRLRDLAQLLRNCGETYFAPDQFRQNTNQFLQTSRTVTFIVQKNKHDIPNYDDWYKANVLTPWAADTIMTWAKDARNVIEKEGDLEMHSTLRTSVLFSYIESQDMVLSTTRIELLKGNLDKLMRFAITKLPPSIADAAVLKIERRWVANSLPNYELGCALTYAYGRLYEVCSDLAGHLGVQLDPSVPHPTSLDPTSNDIAQARYLKLSEPGIGRTVSKRIKADPNFVPPAQVLELAKEFKSAPKPGSLSQTVDLFSKLAKATFEHHGNHLPMLFLFDDKWKQIDFLTTQFADQAEKFLFWRNAADRAAYLRAYALIWVSESWIRDMSKEQNLPIRELPIIGEQLHVVGVDISDGHKIVAWNIRRPDTSSEPLLEAVSETDDYDGTGNIFFVKPVLAAMKAVREKNACSQETHPK